MLRHSSLSELRRLGWPVEQLRIRAGHHFVQSTYVYLHADDEAMRQEWIRTENQMLLRKGSTKMNLAYNYQLIPDLRKVKDMERFIAGSYWENDVWNLNDPFWDDYSIGKNHSLHAA